MPKVLMFGWEFPPFNSGGLGTACFGLTRSLVKLGTDVIFVLPKNIGARADFMNIKYADKDSYTDFIFKNNKISFKELEVFLYPYITETEYHERQQSWLDFLKEIKHIPAAHDLYGEVLRYAFLSRQIAREEKFDVIHAHDWLSFPAGIEAKRISGKKLIAHVHATEHDRAGGSVNKHIYNIEKECLHQADKIIAVSNLTRNNVSYQYGINKKKIEVIHNGIDHDYFEHAKVFENKLHSLKKTGNKLVLFVGRLTIQKGPDYFIQAAKKALDVEPKIYFLIIGAGDMEKRMMHLAASLGISDKILFGGWLRGSELASAYQAADLYVMPSVSEPFGITALESMLNNTPVLVSKQSGIAETVQNVLKVDFWDTDEMANKILSILAYDKLHYHLAINGREEVKEVTWHKAASKCINLYNNLINNSCGMPISIN